MKAGYTIEHDGEIGAEFIIVDNHEGDNTITNWAFRGNKYNYKDEYSIGVWQPKGTKDKN